MKNIFTIPPGQPMARVAAQYVLDTYGREGLAECVLLLPTRRACSLMRRAFTELMSGQAVLLPRILPLGDLESELPGLMPPSALARLSEVPPAMPEWQRIGLLVRQVMAFEQRRRSDVSFAQALGLAQDLAQLHDHCARHAVPLTMEALRALEMPAHYAAHWESSLAFLAIVAEHWPILEQELGLITSAKRQTALMHLLTAIWTETPPDYPVLAIGSTGSQATTAQLLQLIAALPKGALLLPGIDAHMPPTSWAKIAAGHPLYHLRQLLKRCNAALSDLQVLGEGSAENIWLSALASSEEVPHWRDTPLCDASRIKLIPCVHGEEEARVLALLLREAVEQEKRAALVTPDEMLMQRVSAHLKRYQLAPDQMKHGKLAATETGSLIVAMLHYAANSNRVLPLLGLLRHPLLLAQWEGWLAEAEPEFRGLSHHLPGQLPSLPPKLRERTEYDAIASLAQALSELSRKQMTPAKWIAALQKLAPLNSGEGADAVAEALASLAHADAVGEVDLDAMMALFNEALDEAWRGGIYEGHPGIVMLTPVEARLEHFDRVILANMQDAQWPGLARPGAWLNLAQQQALGLPTPEEQASLTAHDLLLLGSQPEVFMTWPLREQGSPTTRSRYMERLLAYLAVHGVEEAALHAPHYLQWARAWHTAADYQPSLAPMPRPSAARRPATLAVTRLNRLTTDPYFLYAYYVLGLRELDPIDKEAEASEFGTLVHSAMAELTQHWNAHSRVASEEELAVIVQAAMKPFMANEEAALFWQHRLTSALQFVNACEVERRAQYPQVMAESTLKQTLALENGAITLHGRIDRMEANTEGVVVSDYKTGKAPGDSEVRDGREPQLLAYALILEAQGNHVAGADYWELPGGKQLGKIKPAPLDDGLLEQLRGLIDSFIDSTSPLLARPVLNGKTERYSNPYDGISRYDEWAS